MPKSANMIYVTYSHPCRAMRRQLENVVVVVGLLHRQEVSCPIVHTGVHTGLHWALGDVVLEGTLPMSHASPPG